MSEKLSTLPLKRMLSRGKHICPVPYGVRFIGVLVALSLGVYALSSFTPYDPFETNYAQALVGPSLDHLLGCDYLGRDMLSRVLLGARYSVLLSCGCVVATMCIGTLIGTCAAMKGGVVDSFLMRVSDVFLAFPEVVLGIALVAFLGPGLISVVIVIVLVMWVRFARIARALVVQLQASDLIFTARLSGCSSMQIFVHYLIKPVLLHMRSIMMLEVGHVMLFLAAFSFLGLGIQPPTPEWGALLNEGRMYFLTAPHLMLAPGCALFFLVTLCNSMGSQSKTRFHACSSRKCNST